MFGPHLQILLVPVRYCGQVDLAVVFLGKLGIPPGGRQISIIFEGLLGDTFLCAHSNFLTIYDFFVSLGLKWRRYLPRDCRHPCLPHGIRLAVHGGELR